MRVKLGQASAVKRTRSILTVCLLPALILVCGSVALIGPAFVSAQSTSARKIRLFEGFTIKILSGTVVIYGETTEVTPVVPSITFLQCVNDGTNLTTYTFTAQNTGTAAADRHTIIGLATQDTLTSFNVTAVTVDGDSATEVADQAGAGSLSSTALYILANPSGTSEDIVITNSEGVSDMTVCVWQANNLLSSTTVDSAVGFSTDASSFALDLDTSADGIAVGMCNQETVGQSTTWTGLTERVDENTGSESWSTADFDEDGTAATPLSVTCDYTGVDDTTGAAASFR